MATRKTPGSRLPTPRIATPERPSRERGTVPENLPLGTATDAVTDGVDDDPLSRGPGQVDHAVLAALEFLDKRWSWQLLYCIHALEPIGYADLRKALAGPTHSIVVGRLQALTAFGYVTRTVHPGPPMRSTYALGPAGAPLRSILQSMDALGVALDAS